MNNFTDDASPKAGVPTCFIPGRVYRLYTQNTYLRQGQMGEFVKKGKRHCQLHGDYIGTEFEFIKVKESGKRSSRFALPPESILRAELVSPTPAMKVGTPAQAESPGDEVQKGKP